MAKKNVLEELSSWLPEKERSALLEKINRSINTGKTEEVKKDKAALEKERTIYINQEINNMGWFKRFLMNLRCRLSGKKLGELIIDDKMKGLKKLISKKQNGITGFESRNLTPEFGEKLFALYSKTFEFREIYKKLWTEQGVYESCCLYIIRAMYEKTKLQLEEFISMDEMVDLYAETGKKEEIVNEIGRRLKDYTASVPEIVYVEIERSIAPIYKLKDIILYPYTDFFQKFSFTPNRSGDGKHFFKNASAMLCLDHLEELYAAVMNALELDEHIPLNRYLIEFLDSLDEDKTLPEDKQAVLKNLIISIKNFARTMPLLEIIQFFRKEPYLTVKYIKPQKSFRDNYEFILHGGLKDEIEKLYPEIQREYIEREIGRIFQGHNFEEFRNYRKYASIDHQKMGLPIFTHTKSLNVLYNYIKCFYISHFSETVSILEKGMLAQNRITRDRLLGYSASIQELEDKIAASDKSLSPENDDGKLFHKLRMSLAAEPAQQRMFRSLVVNKNREVKSLLDWGDEALSGLGRIFEEITASDSNVIKVQLNKHYLLKGKSITLVSLLKTRAEHITEFRRLMAQIIKMELN